MWPIPGRDLYFTDVLSRSLQVQVSNTDEPEDEIYEYIQMFTRSLPASSERLKKLQATQKADETFQKLSSYVTTCWP